MPDQALSPVPETWHGPKQGGSRCHCTFPYILEEIEWRAGNCIHEWIGVIGAWLVDWSHGQLLAASVLNYSLGTLSARYSIDFEVEVYQVACKQRPNHPMTAYTHHFYSDNWTMSIFSLHCGTIGGWMNQYSSSESQTYPRATEWGKTFVLEAKPMRSCRREFSRASRFFSYNSDLISGSRMGKSPERIPSLSTI